MTKPKAAPFFARPDRSSVKSAWLTRRQAPAQKSVRSDLPRYTGRRVGTGSLLGLKNRGCKRQAGGGDIEGFAKPLSEYLCVSLESDDGWFIAGSLPENEKHRIRALQLSHAARFAASTPLPHFADLPAIMVSELIHDLEKMAWHTRAY